MNQEGYVPPRPLDEIRVAGENSLAMIKMAIWTLRQQGYATEHDVTVATKWHTFSAAAMSTRTPK